MKSKQEPWDARKIYVDGQREAEPRPRDSGVCPSLSEVNARTPKTAILISVVNHRFVSPEFIVFFILACSISIGVVNL